MLSHLTPVSVSVFYALLRDVTALVLLSMVDFSKKFRLDDFFQEPIKIFEIGGL